MRFIWNYYEIPTILSSFLLLHVMMMDMNTWKITDVMSGVMGGLGVRGSGDRGGLWLVYWIDTPTFDLFLFVMGVITVFSVCTSVLFGVAFIGDQP